MGCCDSRRLDLVNQKNALYTDSTGFSQEHQAKRLYLHAVLSGIQEQYRQNREDRLKKFSQTQSSCDFESYVSSIAKSIQSQKSKMTQLVETLTSQFGTVEFNENDIYSDVLAYFQLTGITQKEVRDWINQKIKIVSSQGKLLAAKLKVLKNFTFQTISKTQIFQTLIEDKLITDKGFLLSIAFQFIYQNELGEKAEWDSCLQQIYDQLKFMVQ